LQIRHFLLVSFLARFQADLREIRGYLAFLSGLIEISPAKFVLQPDLHWLLQSIVAGIAGIQL
jgi:hypothetical protein